jgi:Ca-activated chloride channel family protein
MRRLSLLFFVAIFASLIACSGAQTRPRSPDMLAIEGALANRYVPAGSRSTLVARLHLTTAPTDPSRRPPINLGLVIDTSGSMEGAPIEDARRASLALVDSLRNGDRLALVVFHSRTEVLVPSVVLDDDSRAEVKRQIGRMRAVGTTDMATGLRMGIAQVAQHLNPQGINRVVLLGDGVPNDPQGIEGMATSAGQSGIAITSLGLGLEYNETLMGVIAQRSGGHFHYIEDSSAVANVFRDEVLRLERMIARNAALTLTPGPDVQIEAVLGQEATRSGTVVTVPIGDIPEGGSRDLIVRMSVPSHRAGSSVELIDAKLGWNDAVNAYEHHEANVFLGARATSDATEIAGGRNAEVERVAAQVSLAVGTVAVIREAREGNVAQAQAELDTLLTNAREQAEYRNHAGYAQQVAQASSLRRALPSLAPRTSVTSAPTATTPAPAAAPSQPAPVQFSDEQIVRQNHAEAMSVIQGD